MTAHKIIIHANRVPINEEVFGRNAFDFDLAARASHGDFGVVHRRRHHHAHRVNLRLLRYFAFDNLGGVVAFQQAELILGQARVVINFNVVCLVVICFGNADFFDKRVVNNIAENVKAVVAVKHILCVFGRLLCRRNSLRPARNKLHRAARLQKHPHQRWLDCAHSIAAFRCYDLGAALLMRNTGFAVKVFLRGDPVRRDFAFDE